MRPGHVNFFDGMRVSAEHMEHLQGSLHSAIADLRGLAGAGHVQEGLDVVSNPDGTITVQPGLAFDFERRRVVCEEPRQLEPTFEDGAAVTYVCIEHAATSTGIVDDVPTLFWDGCRVLMRPDLPGPETNQVPLASVRPAGDSGLLDVTLLGRRAPGTENAVAADGNGAATVAAAPAAPRIRQGIATMRRVDPPLRLASLGSRFGSGGSAARENGGVADANLASELVAIGFPWSSLSCRGVLRIGSGSPEFAPLTGEREPLVGTFQGEATRDAESLSQAALWTPNPHAPPSVYGDSLVSLEGRDLLPAGDTIGGDLVAERLAFRLYLRPADAGLEIRFDVRWTGDSDEPALRALAESTLTLAWDLSLLWKVTG